MNSSNLNNGLGRFRIIAVVAGVLLVMVVSMSGLAATKASITASGSKASAEPYALTDVHDRVNMGELYTGSNSSDADNKLSDTFDRATAIRDRQQSQPGQLLDTWDRATAVQQHSQGTDLLDAHDRATAAFDQK